MAGVAAVAGLGLGIYSAKRESDKAEKATKQTKKLAKIEKQIALEQWGRYLDIYAPLEEELISEAKLPVEKQPGFARMLAEIDRGYRDVVGNVKRTLGGRYPSGAGIEGAILSSAEMNRTRNRAGTIADAEAGRFGRLFNLAQIGRNLPIQAQTGLSSASQTFSNLANTFAGGAKSTWDSLAGGVGNLMSLYLMSQGIPG